jgi:hypothetical protein
MSLATQYRDKVLAASGFDSASDDLVAICFAKDLMQGDPATFKAGYTAENALLAALEIFPAADRKKIEAGIGLLPEPCKVCGGEATCDEDECKRRVVVIENRVGDWEYGPSIVQPIILTADHIELTIKALIEQYAPTHNPDAIIVVSENGWATAERWLQEQQA